MASSRKLSSTDLSARLAAQLGPLLPAHSTILIGLSGGADSIVLLHLLQRLAPQFSWRISALHVHHGISPNADAWAAFCADLCARQDIPLHIEYVDITPLRAQGIEAAARQLRHAAFAAQPCDFVAVAHHADDQAETVLLQLLRGAGARGASAMPVLNMPKRSLIAESEDTPGLLRPLLHCMRREILDYAAAHALRWIEDESNADDGHPRNFLRHRLLPLLEQRFPAYRTTLTRSARYFAEASELMDVLAEQDAQGGFDGTTLAVASLAKLDVVRARNLLRWFLRQCGAPMPDHTRLEEMLRQSCAARADAQVCVAWQDWIVRRYRGRLHACRVLPEVKADWCVAWHGEAQLILPQLGGVLHFVHRAGEGVSLEKLAVAPVTVRLRRGGETLRVHPGSVTHTLKNLLQAQHIPPWQRERLPLLYCGTELVCAVGVAVALDYRTAPGETGIVFSLGHDGAVLPPSCIPR